MDTPPENLRKHTSLRCVVGGPCSAADNNHRLRHEFTSFSGLAFGLTALLLGGCGGGATTPVIAERTATPQPSGSPKPTASPSSSPTSSPIVPPTPSPAPTPATAISIRWRTDSVRSAHHRNCRNSGYAINRSRKLYAGGELPLDRDSGHPIAGRSAPSFSTSRARVRHVVASRVKRRPRSAFRSAERMPLPCASLSLRHAGCLPRCSFATIQELWVQRASGSGNRTASNRIRTRNQCRNRYASGECALVAERLMQAETLWDSSIGNPVRLPHCRRGATTPIELRILLRSAALGAPFGLAFEAQGALLDFK